jgi:hypothetical protein
MATRVRAQQWLSSKEREALLAGSAMLIDSLFDDYHLVDPWKCETIFLTRFGKHLPRAYFSHYTPLFFKQFGACVITMAWKFAQPQPLLPCSLAEQLAGWAILEEAQAILEHERGSEGAPTQAFHPFIARVFPDTAFRLLFDPGFDGEEVAYEPGSQRQTFVTIEDWFAPFPGRTQSAHPYAGGSELVGRAYRHHLTRRERRTLATAMIVLIDEIFEAITLREQDESEQFALFALNWHLPSHYQAEYTPLFQKQFIVCIFTVAWKLVQPRPMALSSVAEELAAWAIITAAKQQVEVENDLGAEDVLDLDDQEEEALSPEDAFENLLEVFLEDEDFLLLFDAENEGIETSPVGQWLHMTSLVFKDWRKPFTDDLERMAHPYVWSA